MGKGNHILRCVFNYNIARCFETYYTVDSSDCHFCYNCVGTHNALFSFNLRGKQYAIGNLQLEKGKFLHLREKLLDEISSELLKKKKFPSLFSLVAGSKPDALPKLAPKSRDDEQNLPRIEKAFASTCRIIFGCEIGPLQKY